ncbi:hypothetical protein [uncultured Sulfitobacter sp.]|uniref:phage pre-tape measure protein n=1 Tax=uncultured Sulfitobacter sp. TaxID=191468 RepID=UPI0025993D61|nr:hypothetical protein [uncultured Sulfitobacter sp.]
MKIADYRARREPVVIKEGQELEVRGLTLADVTRLVERHIPEITQLVSQYQEQKKDVFSDAGFNAMLMSMAASFPDLTAEAICLAADQPDADSIDAARQFGAAASIACLAQIGQLTLEEAGGLKNLIASLMPLLSEGGSLRKGASDPSAQKNK